MEESKVNDLHSYKRLMQLDWCYQFNCSVRLEGDQPYLVVYSDNPWQSAKFGDYMDPIPDEALHAPVGNENQQLDYIEMAYSITLLYRAKAEQQRRLAA